MKTTFCFFWPRSYEYSIALQHTPSNYQYAVQRADVCSSTLIVAKYQYTSVLLFLLVPNTDVYFRKGH